MEHPVTNEGSTQVFGGWISTPDSEVPPKKHRGSTQVFGDWISTPVIWDAEDPEMAAKKHRITVEPYVKGISSKIAMANRLAVERYMKRLAKIAREYGRRPSTIQRIEIAGGRPPSTIQRIGSWTALVIPSKRRKEIVGDFLESIQSAREQGFGRFGRWTLIAAKFLLYGWVVLKLKIGDLAQPSEDAESPESSD